VLDGHPRPQYDPECDDYTAVYNASKNCTGRGSNTWELYQAPIRASFCDDWYAACANDYFCATAGGDYFSCAAHYEACNNTLPPTPLATAAPNTAQVQTDGDGNEKSNNTTVVGVAVGVGALALLAIGSILYMARRERIGKPVFLPMDSQIVNPVFPDDDAPAPRIPKESRI